MNSVYRPRYTHTRAVPRISKILLDIEKRKMKIKHRYLQNQVEKIRQLILRNVAKDKPVSQTK